MNEKFAHTPGPWFVDLKSTYGWPAKLTPNLSIRPVLLGKIMPVAIAKIQRECLESEANARLIAAAPELLEALVALVDDKSQERIPNRLWVAARSAIAKATGKTSEAA